MSKLILIRGLPGSGKSTMAKEMKGFNHYEADMYFELSGEYLYRPELIKEAHMWCQMCARIDLSLGLNVVVSNTFVKRWEMDTYLSMEADDIEIIEATGDYGSTHNVPADVISRMKDTWETLA